LDQVRRVAAHTVGDLTPGERVDRVRRAAGRGVVTVDEQNAGGVPADGEIIRGSHALAARADNGIRERHRIFSFLGRLPSAHTGTNADTG